MLRYTLMDKIGEGGMGVVYRALQNPLGREVAVKVLRADIARDDERLTRFLREVAACLKLTHPNIVKVLDTGERDGKHYYVMELLADGRTLDQLVAQDGPVLASRAAELTMQILDALQYCHDNQVIHRDLKPSNVMIRPGGLATLMDFGLAKDLDASTLLTQPGQALGTPRYMAPEMFASGETTGSVDVWAAGCLLYEMLVARPPFDGHSIMEIATRVSCGEYVPASQLRPELPAGTDALIARFLEKDPETRLASARDAADAVREWSVGVSKAARVGAASAVPSGLQPGMTRPRPTGPMRRLPARAGAGQAADGTGTKPEGMSRPAGEAGPTDKIVRPPTASRGGGSRRKRQLKLAAVLLTAAAFGVGLGVLLRPVQKPAPGASNDLIARAAGELTIIEGASSLEVTFESTLGGGLLLEAEVRGSGPPRRVRVPAELTSTAGRRGLIGGLPPSTRVRLRVLGPDGAELAWRDVTTRSLSEVANELVKALDALAPYSSGQRLVHDMERALRVKDQAERGHKIAQVRRHWELRLRELMSHRRIEALVADLAPAVERLMGSPEVAAETRRRLYELVTDLAELEEIAGQSKVPVPALAGRLVTAVYGQTELPSLPRPRAVVFQLTDDAHEPLEILKPTEPVTAIRMSGEHMIIYSDLRRAADMFVGTFGEGALMAPDPLPLPPPERVRALEITACLNRCNPANGIRVMVSASRSKDRAAWRTVALLRSREVGRHVVSHTMPVEILSGRPLYVRMEFAYSPVRFVFGNVVEQECWLRWLAISYREEPAPVVASPGPH